MSVGAVRPGLALGYLYGPGLGGQFLLVRTLSPTKPGASSMGNRAERVVWQAAGFALFGYLWR
jgi:hypothetical protein